MSRTIRFDEESILGAIRANQTERMAVAVEAVQCRRRRRVSSPTRRQAEQAERLVNERLLALRLEHDALAAALLELCTPAADA